MSTRTTKRKTSKVRSKASAKKSASKKKTAAKKTAAAKKAGPAKKKAPAERKTAAKPAKPVAKRKTTTKKAKAAVKKKAVRSKPKPAARAKSSAEARKARAALRRKMAGFRRLLLKKHDELLQAYASSKGNTRVPARDGTEDYIDYAVSSYHRDFTLSLTEMERKRLVLVEEALKRLGRGEYGRCMQCSQVIPEPRLEVEPWARYCIRCQELDDQGLLQLGEFEADRDEEDGEPGEAGEAAIEEDSEEEVDAEAAKGEDLDNDVEQAEPGDDEEDDEEDSLIL